MKVAAFALCLLVCTAARPGAAGRDDLEERFRAVPMADRRLTGPLFWLHGDESPSQLRSYVAKVAEGGNGSFTAESRPHSDWLGPGWWRDLAICLEEAKRHDLKLWFFDEKWWPSGEVGGQVPERYGSKRLVATRTTVEGPRRVTLDGCGGPRFIGVLAGRPSARGFMASSLVDLASHVRAGALAWDAPAGSWEVVRFAWEPVKHGGRYLVDGASRDCVEWYIRTVYQPHYDHFRADFGKHIAGFFYDEPETPGDWGTEVMRVLAERGVDWKVALAAWTVGLDGEQHVAARCQYREALAEAWGRTLYGGLSRWCRQRGVKSIGHFLEHSGVYTHPVLCAGDMVQLQKYSDMGAIDAVFDQFVWGKRIARDAPTWQTPKLGSSITHAYGKPDDITMVEIFGARGQDLTYPEMKWWTDHMHVSGVNFLIPHSFNPRAPRDTDCPPYFYNGGHEPRWPLYRVFADYTSRLSLMLTGGRHVAPVAVLYPGVTVHEGRNAGPEQVSEALQDALYDCDWLPRDVFERDVRIDGRTLRLRDEAYRAVVLPPTEVISYATLERVRGFHAAGGVVIALGRLPSRSATLGRSDAEVAALCRAVWGAPSPGRAVCRLSPAGGRSYLLPAKPTPADLRAVLAGSARIRPTLDVVGGRTDGWLHALHRVKEGRDVFFVANQNLAGGSRRFRFSVAARGVPECWDALSGGVTRVPYVRRGDRVEVVLAMEPNESVLLVFAPRPRALPARIGPGSKPAGTLPVARVAAPRPTAPQAAKGEQAPLAGAHWIWRPGVNALSGVPPETVEMRRAFTLPREGRVRSARFVGTCDNGFTLTVNGRMAGGTDAGGEAWRTPLALDVASLLAPGDNALEVRAVNGGSGPNPAGLVGSLVVEIETRPATRIVTDGAWECRAPGQARWTAAAVVAPFGAGPWGMLGAGVTLSLVKADPYAGNVNVPAGRLRPGSMVVLEAAAIGPEEAARVWVNGREAGGFIGRPLRLDITRHVRAGRNSVRIEPFAPRGLRIAFYPR